jgi:hypothetical protein
VHFEDGGRIARVDLINLVRISSLFSADIALLTAPDTELTRHLMPFSGDGVDHEGLWGAAMERHRTGSHPQVRLCSARACTGFVDAYMLKGCKLAQETP